LQCRQGHQEAYEKAFFLQKFLKTDAVKFNKADNYLDFYDLFSSKLKSATSVLAQKT
jgi:hypothetical protein